MVVELASGIVVSDVARALGLAEGRVSGREQRFGCPNPGHVDEHPSCDVCDEKGVWICRACGASGDAVGMVMTARGCDFGGAMEWMEGQGLVRGNGRTDGHGRGPNPPAPFPEGKGESGRREARRAELAGMDYARAQARFEAATETHGVWAKRRIGLEALRDLRTGLRTDVRWDSESKGEDEGTLVFFWQMWGPDGEVVGLRERPVDMGRVGAGWPREKDGSPKKSIARSGDQTGLLVPSSFDVGGAEANVFEGEADLLAGLEEGLNALATPGTGFNREIVHGALLEATGGVGTVVLRVQNDLTPLPPSLKGRGREEGALTPAEGWACGLIAALVGPLWDEDRGDPDPGEVAAALDRIVVRVMGPPADDYCDAREKGLDPDVFEVGQSAEDFLRRMRAKAPAAFGRPGWLVECDGRWSITGAPRSVGHGHADGDNGNGNGRSAPAGSGEERGLLEDLDNARRLAREHGEDLRHCDGLGWLAFNGTRWERGGERVAMERAGLLADCLLDEAKADAKELWGRDDKLAKRLIADAIRVRSNGRLGGMVAQARAVPGLFVRPEHMDSDPWLLNAQNGTVDLRTLEVHGHRRVDYLTKICAVPLIEGASAPRWEAFLDEIMDGNEPMISYLQRLAGYTLTGLTSEEMFAVLYGVGANGKSKFVETLMWVMGDYARSTRMETLLSQRRNASAPSPDLAALRGMRMVAASEVSHGRSLDEATIKELTGGDTIAARFLNENEFTFVPELTLWLRVNHRPIIKDDSAGMWRRVHLVPFEVEIPVELRDRRLGEKLKAEGPGILWWAVQGCREWREGGGLNPPEQVLSATRDYRHDMDLTGGFLEDCCELVRGEWTSTRDLHAAYREWAKREGIRPLTSRALGREMGKRRDLVAEARGGGTRGWAGVRLVERRHVEQEEML